MKQFPILIILSLITLCACTNPESKSKPELSLEQKEQIIDFAERLAISMDNYEYKEIKGAWRDDLFKKRIGNLTKTQKSIMRNYWEDEWADIVLNVNVDLVNAIKYNNGRLQKSRVIDKGSYFYVDMATILDSLYVDFFRYRVEIDKGKPVITDHYSFKNKKWLSAKIKNLLNLAVEYKSTSDERLNAMAAMSAYQSNLLKHDTLAALDNLYMIPESHEDFFEVSLLKLRTSESLPDSIYFNVLYTEWEKTQNPYFHYRIALTEGDSLMLNKACSEIAEFTGAKEIALNLEKKNYVWY